MTLRVSSIPEKKNRQHKENLYFPFNMGNSLSSVIKGVVGDSDDDKSTRDTLNSLYALGKSRTETALAEAQNSTDSIYAPINKVIFKKQKIVCNTSVDADKIVDDIKKGIGNLVEGQIMDGVVDIVKEGLNIVLGESSGQISSENTYALIATDIGALMRIDIDIYNFETTTTRLQTTAKRVTAVTMLISSVKLDSLSLNDIRAIVSLKYSSSPQSRQMEILELVTAAYKNDSSNATWTLEEFKSFRALFKNSEYESAALRSKALVPSDSRLAPAWQGEDDAKSLADNLRSRLHYRRDLSGTSKNGSTYANGIGRRPTEITKRVQDQANGIEHDGGAALDSPEQQVPISLVIVLCSEVDVHWVKRMHSYINSFLDGDLSLTSGAVPDDIGGTAITFHFNVTTDEAFSVAIQYFEKVIIPDISNSGVLVAPCSSFHLEYKNVSAATDTLEAQRSLLGPSVRYNRVRVTNTTTYRMGFYSSDGTRVLLVASGATGNLDADVNYLSPNDYSQWRLSAPPATPPPAAVEMKLTAQYNDSGDPPRLRSLHMESGEGDDMWLGLYDWEHAS